MAWASAVFRIPNWFPSSSTTRTRGILIIRLTLVVLFALMVQNLLRRINVFSLPGADWKRKADTMARLGIITVPSHSKASNGERPNLCLLRCKTSPQTPIPVQARNLFLFADFVKQFL
jgi:hypothetical protein